MRISSTVDFVLRAIFGSRAGRAGIISILLGVLWDALAAWQVADFLPSRMIALWSFLNSFWGPLVLVALGVFFLFRAVSKRQPEIQELEAQEWRHQREALDAYLNQMQQWLDDENNSLLEAPPESQRRKMARTRTLEVLERVGPRHKRRILQFLQEHDLINEDSSTVVFLGEANLRGAQLAKMNLINTNLVSVDFSGADLTGAQFCRWGQAIEQVFEAQEKGVPPEVYSRPLGVSRLEIANLSGTVLEEANLGGCVLHNADFNGANLNRADLRGASLLGARNLTQQQIEQAYGGVDQEEPAQNTMLPNSLRPPAAWRKPIYEQRQDRERSRGVFRRLVQFPRPRH